MSRAWLISTSGTHKGKVEEIYKIINSLNVHRRDVFNTMIYLLQATMHERGRGETASVLSHHSCRDWPEPTVDALRYVRDAALRSTKASA